MQYPTLKYKPVVQIAQSENHLEAATNHFKEQISIYGQQILINLVRKIILIIFYYFINDNINNRLIIEVQNKN